VHDTADLEARGVPSAFVATVEFVDGAEAQARSLGVEPTGHYVEHPIQDRTDAEMTEIADQAFEAVVARLVG
jgi:phage-related protein